MKTGTGSGVVPTVSRARSDGPQERSLIMAEPGSGAPSPETGTPGSGAERAVTAGAPGEPGSARASFTGQRLLAARELGVQRGRLGQALGSQYGGPVAAQADLRERGQLGRELLRGRQRPAGR